MVSSGLHADQQLLSAIVVEPGARPHLTKRDPGATLGLGTKDLASVRLAGLQSRLDVLHNRLWAEATHSVVLVLQGMDAAGKDGTIRRVLTGLNPQGCRVENFKAPSDVELGHDYLWRVHNAMPARGLLGVFNRSHYEDVIAARALAVVDGDRCRRRFRHIAEFERMLADEGTVLVKAFLHISKDEQRQRLQERIDDPEKNWKFRRGDLEARARWDEFQRFYEEAIEATSTPWAPWHVVPADHKWVRDVAVTEALVAALDLLNPRIPDPEPGLQGLRVE
jgi:PPK2 family polyphosphate:nucleotide phosphotransferase